MAGTVDGVFDAVVVGGGFYGATLAAELAGAGWRVLVVEREAELLARASFNNQARVHGGYHYPRSLVTGRRSRVNAPRFIADYAEAIDDSFRSYYAVARSFSKVSAAQFRQFCERIGAPFQPADERVRRLFNPILIETVLRVDEVAFDADRLRAVVQRRLESTGVEVWLQAQVERVHPAPDEALVLSVRGADGTAEVVASHVFNCTYSGINRLLEASGLPIIPLKHELTEMALVEPPDELVGRAVTVMCGPFFSCMPFPARSLHSLSHVRYTPHGEWLDGAGVPARDPRAVLAAFGGTSRYGDMLRDASRYLPALARARYRGSLWEIKTVLPRNEGDDGRPILVRMAHGHPRLHCIAGSKIDNVYDMLDMVLPALAVEVPA